MVATHYIDNSVGQRNKAVVQALNFIESLLWIGLVIYFSGAVVGLFFVDYDNPDVENPLARLLWYPMYLLVLILTLRSLPNVIRHVAFSPILILCILWCGITMIWSYDPGVTLRRSIALMMTTLTGLAMAGRYGWKGLVQHIAAAYAILAILTPLVALGMPSKGVMQQIHPGAWSGPWLEKNYMGGHMTRGLLACMCAFAMTPKRFWLWIPAGLFCFANVVMSTSKTALLSSVAMIAGFVFLRMFRRFPFVRVPLLYVTVMGLSIFMVAMLAFPEEMFGLIGKDPSFTGRTDIWELLMTSIREKFWLGHGYGIYWLDPLGPSYYVRAKLEWGVPTAHNGWMESWLSAGLVIIVLFGLQFMITMLLAINRLNKGGVETYWVILSTFLFLIFSMSESTILSQNDISWVIFVATAVKLGAFERPYWRDRASHPFHRLKQR